MKRCAMCGRTRPGFPPRAGMETFLCSKTCVDEARARYQRVKDLKEAERLEQDVVEALEPNKRNPYETTSLTSALKQAFAPEIIKAFNRPSVLAQLLPKMGKK